MRLFHGNEPTEKDTIKEICHITYCTIVIDKLVKKVLDKIGTSVLVVRVVVVIVPSRNY
jgi:hypothetical protein